MLLSIDSSAVTASVALAHNGDILKSEFINAGLTHSETLLPMIKKVMAGTDFANLDAVAVTVGPGSFTGVRIGVATAKGIAFAYDTPCVAVSTLEAIAYNFIDKTATICAVMDARRMQFYNALFKVQDGVLTRLTPDRAISVEDLQKELDDYDNVIIAGDGGKLCFDNINLANASLADDDRLYQNATGVYLAACNKEKIHPDSLVPVYLRPSQAERELKLKKE